MTDEAKNLYDFYLSIATLLGAAIAFLISLHQWRRAQGWQRAEQLDKLIHKFETDELLRLVTLVIDWTDREITYRGQPFSVQNDEVLLALRDHSTIKDRPMFPGEQSTIRDSYDALLSFFNRLEVAITSDLIDAESAKSYFAYWLDHFLRFDKHPDKNDVLKGTVVETTVTRYIATYGDLDSVKRLCEHFKLNPPMS
jgi:hypothetical protein